MEVKKMAKNDKAMEGQGDVEDILNAKPEGQKDSEAGRWKGGRYDTSKDSEKIAWDNLKKMLRYTGDNNTEVKTRMDNLAKAVIDGILVIRKA
jgi:hypothetical protein